MLKTSALRLPGNGLEVCVWLTKETEGYSTMMAKLETCQETLVAGLVGLKATGSTGASKRPETEN